jgi:hypothetical protein
MVPKGSGNVKMKLRDVIFIILAIVAVSIALRYLTFTSFGWNQWLLVTANVIFFTLFFILLQYRKKLPRLPSSIYLAFIVALYAEMFGFPLTMYILMGVFGLPDIYNLEFLLTQVMGEQQFHIIFHYYVHLPLHSPSAICRLPFNHSWPECLVAHNHHACTVARCHNRLL